jgi:ribonuclease VapC
MIVDTSAILAIFLKEEDAAEISSMILTDVLPRMSAASYVEASLRVDREKDPAKSRQLDYLIARLKIEIAPVTADQAFNARLALRDFGKGTGHPAQLNFGDSFAYALAKHYNEPLLFKGNDFSKTDVKIVKLET